MIRATFVLLVLAVAGCNTSTATTAPRPPAETFPYVRVDAAVDKEGNLLEAYAYDGEIDVEQLKRFVKSKRKLADARTFYFLYLFDAPENVKYPKTPYFTGGFNGIDPDEIEAMKHVRAIYETTNFNKFSELSVYKTNSYESTATRYNIQ